MKLKKYLHIYILSLRAYSFPISAGPVLLGSIYGITTVTDFPAARPLLCLASVLCLHASCNILNDYYDNLKGVDFPGAPGPSPILTEELASKRYMLFSGIIHAFFGILFGIILIFSAGPMLLIPGIVGLFIAGFYTGKKFSLKYMALGELAVFIAMGPLIGSAAYYSVTLSFSPAAALLNSMPGMLAAAILLINNIRDAKSDSRAGITTLPILLGKRKSLIVLALLLLLPFAASSISMFYPGISLSALAAWLSLPPALHILYSVSRARDDASYTRALQRTVSLHFLFNILYSAGILFPVKLV